MVARGRYRDNIYTLICMYICIYTNISTHIYYNNKYVICHYKALQTSNAVTVKLIIIISSHVHVYIMNSANDTHISLHSANI
jgi:hypothetical protein